MKNEEPGSVMGRWYAVIFAVIALIMLFSAVIPIIVKQLIIKPIENFAYPFYLEVSLSAIVVIILIIVGFRIYENMNPEYKK